MRRHNSGFTLIELIVVIAVLAVLVLMVAPNGLAMFNRASTISDEADAAAFNNILKRSQMMAVDASPLLSAEARQLLRLSYARDALRPRDDNMAYWYDESTGRITYGEKSKRPSATAHNIIGTEIIPYDSSKDRELRRELLQSYYESGIDMSALLISGFSTITGEFGDLFQGRNDLVSVEFYDDDLQLGGSWGMFAYCANLEEVYLPKNLKATPPSGFAYCVSLKSIGLPTALEEVSYATFMGCSALESIIIPSGVTTIGDSAFSGCSSLSSVTIEGGLAPLSIGTGAFDNCAFTEITLPERVNSIEGNPFSGTRRVTVNVIEGSYAHQYFTEKNYGVIVNAVKK